MLAVSKTHPAEPVAELLAAGQRHFGENRVQEAAEKYPPPLLCENVSLFDVSKASTPMIPRRDHCTQPLPGS